MSTLYRSPIHLVDGFEWYLAVEASATKPERPFKIMRFRAHSEKRTMWRPSSRYPGGKLPKGIGEVFYPYLRHASQAMLPIHHRRTLP